MASKSSQVKVKVSPAIPVLKGLLKNWQFRTVPQMTETAYRNLLNAGVRIMKEEAPSRTGRLRSSITIKTKTKSGGGRDKRYHGTFGPNAHYAKYVERGTGASPGMFVAAIEKRIRAGTHPGTPKNPFVQRTIDKLNNTARQTADIIGKQAKRSLRF